MPMNPQVPNYLTMLRLVLAVLFFVILNCYRYVSGIANPGWILWTAMGVFIFAMLTDIADGYLARKFNAESTFGRIMDPFVDKVIVLGALIYLSGSRFVDPQAVADGSIFTMISGVYPWMVVVIFARELLVTGIRAELESRGVKFGAMVWGKVKTLLQSVGIPTIIGAVALDPNAPGKEWTIWVRDIFAYSMTIVTFISGLPYIFAAMREFKKEKKQDSAE